MFNLIQFTVLIDVALIFANPINRKSYVDYQLYRVVPETNVTLEKLKFLAAHQSEVKLFAVVLRK